MRSHRPNRWKHLRLAALVPALAILAAACNNEPSEVVPQVAGSWQGTYSTGGGGGIPLTIELQQNGNDVSGTLDISSYHFTLTGQVDANGVVEWASSQENPNCITIVTDNAGPQKFGLQPGQARLEGPVKVRGRTAGSGACDVGTFTVINALISVDRI